MFRVLQAVWSDDNPFDQRLFKNIEKGLANDGFKRGHELCLYPICEYYLWKGVGYSFRKVLILLLLTLVQQKLEK